MDRTITVLAHPPTILLASAITAGAMRDRPERMLRFVGVPVAIVVSKLLKGRVRSLRPKLLDVQPFQSFPSGHAVAASAYSVALCDAVGWKKTAPFALAALAVIGFSRVRIGEHRWSDVACGALIGAAGAAIGIAAGRLYERATSAGRRGRPGRTSRRSSPSASDPA